MREALGESLFDQLEIAEANLLDADSLGKAIEGAHYVVHSAFPLVQSPKVDVKRRLSLRM